MSAHTMEPKDCGHHDEERRALRRRIFIFILGLLVLILLIIFIVFLILRPSKPSFVLRDATVYEFNATLSSLLPVAAASPTPGFLSSNLQVTVSSRNPNGRIGIYYYQLDASASYRGQQVTLPVLLPESYQGHKEVTDWSPFLIGRSVPVSPYLGDALSQDLNAGMVLLNVKIDGRVKWKVGTWTSGPYHLHVNCPALLMLKASGSGAAASAVARTGLSMKAQLAQHCTVDV
ncbi:hypothetical protein SAY87_016585 [Trapa incisa]|uniref:Late embryogenesis abundant protein LEA-2 subgroup domain-containing protein n=1 Tax=Trapa incisa TaxID=236973 RepID=A0AAN7LAB7_9MYRT|nr:hypothetical protein SAY87_016585 [Trapa incisa]